MYAGFTATGISIALPGALMPWLLAHWSLQDSRGGVLLFLFFFGNTCGALASRGSLRWSIVRGAICTSLGAALLPFASSGVAYAAIFLYGLGLGITMTSISLLQSRVWATNCAAELTRLNLFWAIGASSGPWLVLHDGVRDAAHSEHVLLSLAVAFAVFAVWAMALGEDPQMQVRPSNPSERFALTAAPLPLLVLVFCATGVESSSGGWLATYSQRSGHSLAITIGAATCFWAGLFVSRLLHSSSRIGLAARGFLLTWNLAGMVGSVAVLILFRDAAMMLAAAFVVGFTVGPMYPLLLALVFEHDGGNIIFVLAGLGAASLPLLTGTISSATRSLRAGLVVPCAAAAAMALAGWSTWRSRRTIATEAVVTYSADAVAQGHQPMK
jgi:hypothetical protein